MFKCYSLAMIFTSIAFAALTGCSGSSAPTSKASIPVEPKAAEVTPVDPEIAASIALLPAEERKLAEEQKNCPITGEPLGSMGMPLKVMLNDRAVFLCCKSCKKKAEANPEKTLKAAAEAKAK